MHNVCKTYPSLNPLKLRQTKAREVFLLFGRLQTMMQNEKKYTKQVEKVKKKEEAVDVTGQYNGWY